MQFGIVWDDGFQTRDYDADLANSQPFKTFVEARKELFPLQFTVKEARQKMKEIRQQVITSVSVGSTGYISLRVFDGTNNGWYDALQLPVKEKLYVVPYLCKKISRGIAHLLLPTFNIVMRLDNYDVTVHSYQLFDTNIMIEVTDDMRNTYPNIWK